EHVRAAEAHVTAGHPVEHRQHDHAGRAEWTAARPDPPAAVAWAGGPPPPPWAPESRLHFSKSKVRYSPSMMRAMPWYTSENARRTDVTWIGRYERLRSRTGEVNIANARAHGTGSPRWGQ